MTQEDSISMEKSTDRFMMCRLHWTGPLLKRWDICAVRAGRKQQVLPFLLKVEVLRFGRKICIRICKTSMSAFPEPFPLMKPEKKCAKWNSYTLIQSKQHRNSFMLRTSTSHHAGSRTPSQNDCAKRMALKF